MQQRKTLWLGGAVLLVMAVLLWTPFSQQATAASAGTTFTFSNTGITSSGSGSGYEISGTDLKITAPGTYTITGSSSEGTITVKKELSEVTLILKNLTLSSTQSAPLTINKSSRVTVQVTGSNTLTDNEDPALEGTSDTFEGAGIKVKSTASLTLIGSGALTVNGVCNNGIKGAAEASVTVNGPTLTVTASNNALASDGSVLVESGILNLTAAGDGIKSEPDATDTTSAGTVAIHGGQITIASQGDGIQATGEVSVTGGTLNLESGGGYQQTLEENLSAKGIKSTAHVILSGGIYTLDCADDAIHSNGDITITDGTFSIRTGDDAIHADAILSVGTQGSINGPKLTISSCYEGFEAMMINLYSGSADITASDDGINAASGDIGNISAASLNLYGGTWKVNASGDGIDSNGDIHLYGGVLEAYGTANGPDSALDYDGSCYYEGGTLLAVGVSSMAMAPSNGTYVSFGTVDMMGGFGQGGQRPAAPNGGLPTDAASGQGQLPSRGQGQVPPDIQAGTTSMLPPGDLLPNSGTGASSYTISVGDSIAILDEAGDTLYTATGLKQATHLVFTHDTVTAGTTYTLSINGGTAATATAVTGTGRTNGGMTGRDPSNTPGNGSLSLGDISRDSWYYPAVRTLLEMGIMSGTSGTTFSPEAVMTRGMLAKVLYHFESQPKASETAGFTDITVGTWYEDAINWAASAGIVSGYGDGRFGPGDAVTREQMVTVLHRWAQYKGYATDTESGTDLNQFTDSSRISEFARSAIQWASSQNLISGTDEGALLPTDKATRAQAAVILVRVIQHITSPVNGS